MIRVFIVDDHPFVREGLKAYLGAHGEMEIVGEAGDAESALPAIKELQPDIALVDLRLAVLEERNRIARELHDSVSQNLFGLSLHLDTLHRTVEKDPGKTAGIINRLRQMVAEIQTEMRLMIHEMRPPALKDRKFLEALESLVDMFHTRYDLTVLYQVAGNGEPAIGLQSVLYRVLQESLYNIVKHAGATKAQVELNLTGAGGELVISDDGRGAAGAEQADGHFGLTGMKERVEKNGGEFFLRSEPGKGTTVTVRF